jgi:hypothetical protein
VANYLKKFEKIDHAFAGGFAGMKQRNLFPYLLVILNQKVVKFEPNQKNQGNEKVFPS